MISYITSTTGSEKMFFLGHSMGSTEFLVAASDQPAIQESLHAAFLLAPPAFFAHPAGIWATLAPLVDTVNEYFESTGHWELFPDTPLTSIVSFDSCKKSNPLLNGLLYNKKKCFKSNCLRNSVQFLF